MQRGKNAVASEVDYSRVIEKFASLKARRVFELRVTVKCKPIVLREWMHEDQNVLFHLYNCTL